MALTLYYNFAKNQSLKASRGPTLDITRATIGTYVDSSGVLRTASAGEARFGHDPVTGAALGLLTEESRENICLQSQDWDTTWFENATSVINTNVSVAPDGTLSADQIIDDESTGPGGVLATQNITFATSTTYVVSVFAKADQLEWFLLQIINLGALTIQAYFDLTNGTVGSTPGADNTSEFIEDYGDGWYRCGIVFDSDAADTSGAVVTRVADGDNDATVELDGTSSIFVWQADLQAGEFPTSPIPTTTTSVTRNADVVSTTDVGWLGTDGSIYCGFNPSYDPGSGTFPVPWEISDNSANNRIQQYLVGGNTNTAILTVDGGVTQGQPNTTGIVYGGHNDYAGVYATDDLQCWINGTSSVNFGPATTPTGLSKLNLGSAWNGGNHYSGHIKELRYYDERLTDTESDNMSTGIFPQDLRHKKVGVRHNERLLRCKGESLRHNRTDVRHQA